MGLPILGLSPRRESFRVFLRFSPLAHLSPLDSKRDELLRESLFIIGVGNPVLGVTPLEAIAAGTAYLNPVYPTPKHLWENGAYVCSSQHTFAQQLGQPFAYDYVVGNVEQAKLAVGRAVAHNGGKGFAPHVPPEYSPEGVARKVLESIEMDFDKVSTPGDVSGRCVRRVAAQEGSGSRAV